MNKIEFGWLDKKVIIRVVGKGSFLNSRHLKEGITELLREGYLDITVDLHGCGGMDSTFIGVLTGITLNMKKKHQQTLCLANVKKSNIEILETLGVLRFFHILEEPCSFQTEFESVEELPDDPDGAINQIKLILEAHENLMKVDDRNVERFKSVKQELEKDLSRRIDQKKKS